MFGRAILHVVLCGGCVGAPFTHAVLSTTRISPSLVWLAGSLPHMHPGLTPVGGWVCHSGKLSYLQ